MIGELINHLWQSTLFAVAAALLTLTFRNSRAAVRYRIWLSASLKFLIPFAVLMNAGGHLRRVPQPKAVATQALSTTITQIAQPFHQVTLAVPTPRSVDWVPIALAAVWACGSVFLVIIRLRGWLRICAAIRSGSPMPLHAAISVRSTPGLLEPGVVGLFRPVLLLPADIMERLTPAQLKAVIAHETQHVTRRDNLTAALHMLTETLFWFHPLVWWIGARLIGERESACDEAVLSVGCEPRVYAEAIVRVCQSYVESPLLCASGVSGADMKKRIEAILTGHVPAGLTLVKKSILAVATAAAIAGPIVIGVMNAPALRAQFRSGPAPKFAAASIRSCSDGALTTGRGGRGGGAFLGETSVSVDAKGNFVIPDIPARLFVSCASPRDLINTAYAMFADGHVNQSIAERPDRVPVEGPAWIASDRYNIDATPESQQDQDTINGPMLQGLLEDRFQLKIHRETREVQGYALTVASGGFKAPPFRQGECLPVNFGQFKAAMHRVQFTGWVLEPTLPPNFCPNRLAGVSPAVLVEAHGVTVDDFADTFLLFGGKPVANRTGIKGLYDFRLEFAAADPSKSAIVALEDQLGLKLEPALVEQEILVVDSVERPM
jgi:uncharacterized protein (TIGR03435 family)